MRSDPALKWLLGMGQHERNTKLLGLSEDERSELRYHWPLWARNEQLPPDGDWRVWMVMAGRGFGKTRTGAEWVRLVAKNNPNARIALVGASLAEARSVMVEGESGILSCCAPRRRPKFEPSLRRLTWPNGAQATLYSACDPDGLRGPQHSHAWCDEIAKWENSTGQAVQCWNNLLLGLRLGDRPQTVATTTPRAATLMERLLSEDDVILTKGRSEDNRINLPMQFLQDMRRAFGNSLLARQELDGEFLTDREGGLWTRKLLETCREAGPDVPLARLVIGVDPPASARGDACGIIVAGLGDDGIARILADVTVEKASPERWARAVADAAVMYRADRVVAEANQGGAMVESVLRAADIALPIKLVHATAGKSARAEPVAALYEAGRVRHRGTFPALEDQLCGLMPGGAYEGPGRSPDRADAAVWALTELQLQRRHSPRVSDI
jgi:phage terminase large subunit-like protein